MSPPFSIFIPEFSALAVFFILLAAEILMGPKKPDDRATKSFCLTAFLGTVFVGLITFSFCKTTGTAFRMTVSSDPLGYFFKLLFVFILAVTIPMAYLYLRKRSERTEPFILIQMLCLIGMFFLASAHDLFLLFLCIEIVTLSFYIMVSYLRHDLLSIEAGLKYLVLGSLASAMMIFGIGLIYVAVGSTAFGEISAAFKANPANRLLVVGMLLLISGVGFKIAAAPFHLWVPDVYEGAPTPAVAFLSVGSKAAGFLALIRLVTDVFPFYDYRHHMLFSALAVMTVLYGNLGALNQTSIKRLMGYSSIGHAGFLLMGIVAYKEIGIAAVLYYLCAYTFSNLTVFLVIIIVYRKLKSDQIHAYRGLAKRSPFLAASLFIALLSLAGVPPTAGFFGKFLILLAVVASHTVWLAVIGGVCVVISLYYYLNIVRVMYVEDPVTDEKIKVSFSYKFLMGILLAGILILGLYQEPFHSAVMKVAYSLSQNSIT
jgi:NADH-quinone oxidoreductase subunit N